MRASRSSGHAALASRAVLVGATALALMSAAWGVRVSVPWLEDARAEWSALPSHLRDDPVADLLGFDDAVWARLRRSVGEGDRYAVVAAGDGQHEVRNYAAYTLLPAIQVQDPAQADVVVYYEVDPPAAGCTSVGAGICVARAP